MVCDSLCISDLVFTNRANSRGVEKLSTYPRLDVKRLGYFVAYLYGSVVRELFKRILGFCTVFQPGFLLL